MHDYEPEEATVQTIFAAASIRIVIIGHQSSKLVPTSSATSNPVPDKTVPRIDASGVNACAAPVGLGVLVAVYTPVKPEADVVPEGREDAVLLLFVGLPGTPASTVLVGRMTEAVSW